MRACPGHQVTRHLTTPDTHHILGVGWAQHQKGPLTDLEILKLTCTTVIHYEILGLALQEILCQKQSLHVILFYQHGDCLQSQNKTPHVPNSD